MPELRRNESGLRHVQQILADWIAAASAALGRKKVTDTNIHDARKQLKKARAALRLLRGSIGEIAYRRENTAIRDAARPLGLVRDTRVLIDALDTLVERRKSEFKQSVSKFHRQLRKEQTQARRELTPTLMKRQRAALRAVLKRSERWRLQADDETVIGDGVVRIYRSARKKLAKAKDSRDAEHLHDWRKQVKYLWHQLQILQPLRPGKIGELADQCHRLADYLGDDHDLAVLRQRIECHGNAFERQQELDELLQLLDRRRVQLQDKALTLGSRIFDDKPRAFAQRLGKYWKAWGKSERV